MGIPLRALIIEDSEDDAALLLRELRRGGYDPLHERVETEEAMNAALDKRSWEIAFADYSMPRFNGLAALKILRGRGLDIPYIFVSGTIGEDTAVEAMRTGANDYIMKNNLKRLIPAVERELRDAKVREDRRQAEDMVQHMAYYDILTDLPNRNWLFDRLLDAIRRDLKRGQPMALMLMDLDRFRDVNDTLGHHRGDLVLEQVGLRLKSVLFEPDTVARLGGDEFAVFLPRLADPGHIHKVARKIQASLEAPIVVEGVPIRVEASIGAALYPDHGADPQKLLQCADVAMYAAKKKSDEHVVYDPRYDTHNPRRLALMGQLKDAIEAGQLFLNYQPKIDLLTGRTVGVEALARWKHPEFGFIPPDQFIPSAERTGLIGPLTRWILSEAQRQCLTWEKAGKKLSMAVNLSARNLHDSRLPDHIKELVESCGGRADHLELEITESAIMDDPANALEWMNELRRIGVEFAIDDFGTGYTSLTYLKQLPVNTLKIDKSFVMHMIKNENDAVIVRSTIELAHNLGLKVVAEGIETQEVFDALRDLGCEAGQGYHMSKPQGAEDLTRWLDESPWGFRPEDKTGTRRRAKSGGG